MVSLAKRIGKLADDVEKIKDRNVAWEVGQLANALIAQAKQEMPNDPVLDQVEPFAKELSSEHILRLSPQEVVAILRQVAEAIPPAPAVMLRAGRTITADLATRQW